MFELFIYKKHNVLYDTGYDLNTMVELGEEHSDASEFLVMEDNVRVYHHVNMGSPR